MSTHRRPFRSYSLRVLLVVMAVICAGAAVVRIHYRNLDRIKTVQQLIAAANGSSSCPERAKRRWHFAQAYTIRCNLTLDRITPEGYSALKQAAARIDASAGQRMTHLQLGRGGGLVDLPRARAMIEAFAPETIEFYGVGDREFAALTHRLHTPQIDHSTRFPAAIEQPLVLQCDRLRLAGPKFARFWQNVSSQSEVRILEVKFQQADEILMFDPIPSLQAVSLEVGFVTELQIVRLMSNLGPLPVYLVCSGPSPEDKVRLEETFPQLTIEVIPNNTGLPLDPFQ